MESDRLTSPHRRLNPLTGSWVLVSPQRTLRPWQGQVEATDESRRPAYDASCYLCPGNARAGGNRNPDYTSTYIFTNDFPALVPGTPPQAIAGSPLLQAEGAPGTCRVVCFSPRHDLSLAEMGIGEITQVVNVWAAQTSELGRHYRWVQVFENKGEMMGCSNPHPHGQIWASARLPSDALLEDHHQRQHWQTHAQPLLVGYADLEAGLVERIVVEEDGWLAVVPYWAVWPFETLVLPREPAQRMPDLTEGQRAALARLLKRLLARYDNLFRVSFPYSMGWHGAPIDGGDHPHWQLHAHFYPPLLRSAAIRKFMVGYEMLAEPQRDLTPEQAAERLRSQPDRHFRDSQAG